MTIKDIARLCGVSVSTVSRVLNDKPDVSPAVRERVMEAMRSGGYIPNVSARSLVRTSSDNIGLVVRGVSNPFYSGIIKAVEREISAAGFTMVMQQIGSGDDEVKCAAIMEREKKLRGIVLLGGRSDYSPEELKPLNVPFVCCSYTNSFGTLPEDNYSSVSIEDVDTARAAVESLIKLGHRRIAALVSDTADRSISELRYLGYVKALEENGLTLDEELVECAGSFGMDEAYAAMQRLMKRRDDFTAVFIIADAMAIAAMKALFDGGRPVPESCSVIAIDGLQLSEYVRPRLSTLRQPCEEMGTESVRILVDMIMGRAGNRRRVVKAELRPGASVAPPSQ